MYILPHILQKSQMNILMFDHETKYKIISQSPSKENLWCLTHQRDIVFIFGLDLRIVKCILSHRLTFERKASRILV